MILIIFIFLSLSKDKRKQKNRQQAAILSLNPPYLKVFNDLSKLYFVKKNKTNILINIVLILE